MPRNVDRKGRMTSMTPGSALRGPSTLTLAIGSRWFLCLAMFVVSSTGCLFRGDNWVKVHDSSLLPFELDQVTYAAWGEYQLFSQANSGYGVLFMASAEITCQGLEDAVAQLLGEDGPSTVVDSQEGLVAIFSWEQEQDEAVDWEGIYLEGGFVYSDEGALRRGLTVTPFSRGTYWETDFAGNGVGEILSHDTYVKGRIRGDVLDANFKAENCGSHEDTAAFSQVDTAGGR